MREFLQSSTTLEVCLFRCLPLNIRAKQADNDTELKLNASLNESTAEQVASLREVLIASPGTDQIVRRPNIMESMLAKRLQEINADEDSNPARPPALDFEHALPESTTSASSMVILCEFAALSYFLILESKLVK